MLSRPLHDRIAANSLAAHVGIHGAQRHFPRCGCCLVLFPEVPALSQSPEEM